MSLISNDFQDFNVPSMFYVNFGVILKVIKKATEEYTPNPSSRLSFDIKLGEWIRAVKMFRV
jgi:hypothetical protein